MQFFLPPQIWKFNLETFVEEKEWRKRETIWFLVYIEPEKYLPEYQAKIKNLIDASKWMFY